MFLYLLKYSACLAIFLVFYKLLLEKETIHNFKRFYLLSALVVSFIIPSITFIEYIEPEVILGTFQPILNDAALVLETPEEVSINYLPIILGLIYGIGVLLFGLKFFINLFRITKRIQHNPKYKNRTYTNVLLLDLITPHTFFNYIFLNKNKFETQQIPEEVLLHEEAHAKQKHSLDIIFIELLQVIFWFNPLVYLSKKAIKLNHEFLADKAVLNQGIQPLLYQQMLLAFSSNAAQPTLANAINYSLIKKRFTIMKSQTSKKAVWLRSLLLLPLLGGLLFSFSNTKQIEKEVNSTLGNPNLSNELIITLKPDGQFLYNDNTVSITDIDALITSKTKTISVIPDGVVNDAVMKKALLDVGDLGVKGLNYNTTNAQSVERLKDESNFNTNTYRKIVTPSPYEKIKNGVKDAVNNSAISEEKQKSSPLKLNRKTIPVVNGIKCDNCTLFLSKTGVEKLIISTTTGEAVTKFRIKFPGKSTESINGNTTNNNAKIKANLESASIGTMVQIFDIRTKDEKLSSVLIELVDRNSPKYSKSPIVKKSEKSDLPPPPPPPPAPIHVKKGRRSLNQIIESTPKDLKSGYKTINGESHYYITYKSGITTYYNRLGKAVDKNGKELPPPPPPPKPVNVKENKHEPKKMAEAKASKESIEAISKRDLKRQVMEDRKIALLNSKKEALNKRQIELNEKVELRKQILKNRKTAKKEALNKRRTELKEKRNRSKEMAEAKVKTGYLDIDGKKHYYTTIDGKTRYFNRYGVETNKKGKELTPNKQVSSDQVLPNSNISKVYFNDKVVSEFKTTGQSIEEEVPEVPSMLELKNKGAAFYYEGKKITGKKAIDLVDNNRDLNILIRSIDTKQPIVKLSTEPITL